MSLLSDLLKDSRVSSTANSYFRGFNRYRQWVASNGIWDVGILPVEAFRVTLYLASLIETANTPSAISCAF